MIEDIQITSDVDRRNLNLSRFTQIERCARVTITDPRVNLGTNRNSLFPGGGTALVIHTKADDMKTDPSGNSGDRIACG